MVDISCRIMSKSLEVAATLMFMRAQKLIVLCSSRVSLAPIVVLDVQTISIGVFSFLQILFDFIMNVKYM